MTESAYPDFIRRLPECDIPVPGIRGWLMVTSAGSLLFSEVDEETPFPEHSHCAQFGIVVRGEIDLTIGGETKRYKAGDSYVIPEDVPHKAIDHPHFASIDFFTDPTRYRVRPEKE